MIKTLQVDENKNIVIDYDSCLSVNELYDCVKKFFPEINKDNDGIIYGSYNGKKYSIRVKNVTYLGKPHPLFKKRIQIACDLKDFHEKSLKKGYHPILLGIYSYGNNIIFCDFDISNLVNKKANNSSAHISIIDIIKASEYGYFEKIDYFNNKVSAFLPKKVFSYLDKKLIKPNILFRTDAAIITDNFFDSVKKTWYGIDAYKEMINAKYNNCFQAEWVGFYTEYKLWKYIDNNKKEIISFLKNKGCGETDLDLFFPVLNCYGDLKAHSTTSGAILGNDYDTIKKSIETGRSIYYIVCEHDTYKDALYNFEVTRFWNSARKKTDLLSYGKKMKHHIILREYYILDINKNNFPFLKIFQQGKNSNGKSRNPKIMIEKKNINNFLIHRKVFD